jgi:hypothetical protein
VLFCALEQRCVAGMSKSHSVGQAKIPVNGGGPVLKDRRCRLVRAHLRALAPLPSEEVAALAIGRNLNQIARVAQQTGRITGPNRDDLRSMLKVCEAMREHVKELVRVNMETWESGYAEKVG